MIKNKNAAQPHEELHGVVTSIRYKSDDGSFTIGNIDEFIIGKKKNAGTASHSFVAKFGIEIGDRVVLYGEWTVHPQYGNQFTAESFEYDIPWDAAGLAAWLEKNPAFKGIGCARAAKIAELFGNDFDFIIQDEPERISNTIAGVTPAMVELLKEEWNKTKHTNQVMTALAALSLTYNQVQRLIDRYGADAGAL